MYEPLIENRTFHEIEVGDSASLERTLSWRDVELFAVMSGDINPAHVDEEYARTDRFHGIVAHGMWGASLISALIGTQLPGPGTIYLEQTLRFRHPITIGDKIAVSVVVASKDPVGIAIFSYNGLVTFGVIADSESTPDIEVLAHGIEEGIDELLALVPGTT